MKSSKRNSRSRTSQARSSGLREARGSAWVAITEELPPVRVEVLVGHEGVDANARAMLLKNGKWKFARRKMWMAIEANAVKTVTHWYKTPNDPHEPHAKNL